MELMWQGFGLSKTLGIEGFPSSEAFRLGTKVPNVTFPRVFIRQTFGLGGEPEPVPDNTLNLAGSVDASRLTLTLGKLSAKDIFNINTYANDPRTQFMNWGLVSNEAWDYPADSLGYETGFAADLNLPPSAVRYGLFQMSSRANDMAQDTHYLEAWGMVIELERRFVLNSHPGAARFLAFLNSAHMGSFAEALDSPTRPADIIATRAYRLKYGFGVNLKQEVVTNVGAFVRLLPGDKIPELLPRNRPAEKVALDLVAGLGMQSGRAGRRSRCPPPSLPGRGLAAHGQELRRQWRARSRYRSGTGRMTCRS